MFVSHRRRFASTDRRIASVPAEGAKAEENACQNPHDEEDNGEHDVKDDGDDGSNDVEGEEDDFDD